MSAVVLFRLMLHSWLPPNGVRLAAVLAICLLATPAVAQETSVGEAEELFVHRVLPLLQAKCFACHGDDPDDIKGEFNMLSREGLLQGGESGEPALIPGQPDESPLVQAIRWESYEMPPKENDRLRPEEIEHFVEWIRASAPWPAPERIEAIRKATDAKWNSEDGVVVRTSGGLSPDWTNRRYDPENLWAYQPLPAQIEVPDVPGFSHPIDAFIHARLNELGLKAADSADRATLIRRVTFDLIGLPPTPGEIDAFVQDPADDTTAFEKVIERLLASPHYGEQWARHWLDVVRYADSSGYANDYERGTTWRYRDYVVRAFNSDKPYDQFIREQIAGDELDPSNPEYLIATGFLRMGPWELTGMEVAKVARQRFLDDVTDAVGQVFLGHMLQCARCHDHKFDPVPTQDYYSIQAVFATTQLADRPADFLPVENTSGFEERKHLQKRRQHYQKTLQEVAQKITVDAARTWFEDNDRDPSEFKRVLKELQSRKGKKKQAVSVNGIRAEMAKQNVDPSLIPPRHVGFEPRDFGLERVGRKGLQRLKWREERYRPIAFSVYTGKTPRMNSVYAPLRLPEDPDKNAELETTSILAGGDPFSPVQEVTPSALSVACGNWSECDLTTADQLEGRRAELADWIADARNPLTARVMMNRLWQWHFGQAIAGNPNNFGATGKKPTHPALLDYLARQFIDSGWSVKSMHRLILTSQTYRRASHHAAPDEVSSRDPENQSYAVFQVRRLEAEEIRDTMLAASGELNRTLGGIPIRPEMNLEAALQPRQVMGTFAEAWQPNPLPEQRHRRSLYALKLRGQRDPFMEIFNAPSPDLSCEARDTSTVTPQVFAMFNSEITFDRALALAYRVTKEIAATAKSNPAPTPQDTVSVKPAHIVRIFRLTCGRKPEPQETAACLEHWRTMTSRHESLQFDPPNYPLSVERHAVEENTGEKFSFTEPLEVYADFVPDLKAHDASASLRGLAEVCLVIMNSNEFAYVY